MFRAPTVMFSEPASFLLGAFIASYICRQQNRLKTFSKPLPADQVKALAGYFSSEILQNVRLTVADPLPIPDPPFLSLAQKCGLVFASPSLVAGITFGDLIAVRDTPSTSLLFHELVHVVQFRLLGVAGFAREYVRGFLQSGNYYEIPLERCAFDLQRRFDAGQRFDTEAAVEAVCTVRRAHS